MDINQILKKLHLPGHDPVLIINAPDEYGPVLSAITAGIDTSPSQFYRFVHVFVHSLAEIEQYIPVALNSVEDDAILWISYPKKSSKNYRSDITRDSGWETLGKYNYEPVTQISINNDWSALRFRMVEHIKTMKRNFALSEKGKARIEKKSGR